MGIEITEQNEHQIIFPGIVYDSEDPMMLGRIRVIPQTKDYESIIKGIDNPIWDEKKDPWGARDPIIFLPMLPFYVYQVPKKGEYVSIIYQNKLFPNKNQFYIQNAFSSPLKLNYDSYQASTKFLSLGDRIKKSLSIRNKDGSYAEKKSRGIFPEPGDNAIMGRFSSDLILKDNEALLRAGKVLSLSPSQFPSPNINRSFLQLSNFTQTKKNLPSKSKIGLIEDIKNVKKIIIWDITNLENTQNVFNGSVGLYTVIPQPTGEKNPVTTKNFGPETIKKISIGVEYQGPIEEIIISNKSFFDSVLLINSFIEGVFNGFLNVDGFVTNSQENVKPENTFPLVITPSKGTASQGNIIGPITDPIQNKEFQNYTNFYNEIKINGSKKESGFFLISENKSGKPIMGAQTKTKINLVKESEWEPSAISYAVLGGQKIYLLSQNSTHPSGGKINLNDTIYGIPQEKFIGDNQSIESLSFSSVRGEKIISLIRKMFSFIKGHVHAVPVSVPIPVAEGNGVSTQEIDQLLAEAENTILNKNIRIN